MPTALRHSGRWCSCARRCAGVVSRGGSLAMAGAQPSAAYAAAAATGADGGCARGTWAQNIKTQ